MENNDGLFSTAFWADAGERAIKSFAQGLLGSASLGQNGIGLLNINWLGSFSLAGSYAVASLLTSIISAKITNRSSASLLK